MKIYRPGNGIMAHTGSPRPCLSHPTPLLTAPPRVFEYLNLLKVSHAAPRSPLKPPPAPSRHFRGKGRLIYKMLLCQLVKVQVVQEAALQDVTRCRAYLLSYCNISLARVNELDTGCPRPARQTELLCTPPSFVSACRQAAAAASENSPSTTQAGGRRRGGASAVITCAFFNAAQHLFGINCRNPPLMRYDKQTPPVQKAPPF